MRRKLTFAHRIPTASYQCVLTGQAKINQAGKKASYGQHLKRNCEHHDQASQQGKKASNKMHMTELPNLVKVASWLVTMETKSQPRMKSWF